MAYRNQFSYSKLLILEVIDHGYMVIKAFILKENLAHKMGITKSNGYDFYKNQFLVQKITFLSPGVTIHGVKIEFSRDSG